MADLRLDWRGPKPPDALGRALHALGVTMTAPAPIAVLVTARPEAPGSPGTTHWVWASQKAIPPAQAQLAAERGAYDSVSLSAPKGTERLLARLRELFSAEPEVPTPPGFIAESSAAKALLKKVAQAARTSMPVLLTGETGTGKELAARLIHQWSNRSKRTFVPVNCAAIPNELMEGELFGYVKGAFSGAVRDYDGLMVAAEGGTVFLDEIDDTPHALQVKLLRVLEDRMVNRLGESAWHKVDFRILAATNRDLRKLIDDGTFGPDLYERLATVSIELPPLRERIEDLPPLLDFLIRRFYEEEPQAKVRVRSVTAEALSAMSAYPWPGNVRELRNVVFGALVAKRAGEELLASDLPRRLLRREERATSSVVDPAAVARRVADGTMNLKREIEALEKLALLEALRRSGGNAAEAARLLGEVGRGEAKDPGGTVRTMAKRLGLRA
ncbi:MAG: sigma-54 dependent transcriptional regulator [Myxococcaceae bacterium]